MAVRLSIIIPVYNVEAYLGKTLASVFATVAPEEAFEVIVVNDGTEDGSMEVVRRFADRTNLTILEQENQGLSAARMNGLALAKGEYVWFVDSDDYLVEDAVKKVLGRLDENKDDEMLLFPLLYVHEEGEKGRLDFNVQEESVVEGKDVIRNLGIPVYASQRFILKRSLFNHPWLHFPLGLLHEDEYFGPVLMCLAKRVRILKDPVYCQRYRTGSIMSGLTVRSSYDLVSVHRLLMRFMDNHLGPEDQGWFKSYCCHRLMTSCRRDSRYFGTPAFNRFVHKEGRYVWEQWRRANPKASLRKKVGKFLFFTMPVLYTKWRLS